MRNRSLTALLMLVMILVASCGPQALPAEEEIAEEAPSEEVAEPVAEEEGLTFQADAAQQPAWMLDPYEGETGKGIPTMTHAEMAVDDLINERL